MTQFNHLILAGLLLGLPVAASAQSSAPANVVTPAPPPREGTVGPEQLRDFALPGTRQAPAPAPAAEEVRQPPVQPPAPTAPTRPATNTQAEPQPRPQAPPATAEVEPSSPASRAQETAETSLPASTVAEAVPLPVPQPAAPLPPLVVTEPASAAPALLPAWWPWLLVAALAGIGLALALRQRRRPVPAGHEGHGLERAATAAPQVPVAPPLAAPPPPAPPPMPAGLVTTRLRSAPPAPQPAPVPPPPPVAGAVVSRRLRGWIELDLVVREILFDQMEAVLRVDLLVANGGTAAARNVAVEAVTTNGGEEQGAELASFFARPAAAGVAIQEMGPLGETVLSHELRMPRTAIRAYEAQGRTLFVPVVAFNAVYRTAAGEGRTSAAFLVGRDMPGSERLAPLLLPEGSGRLVGLGVRRLDEAVRR